MLELRAVAWADSVFHVLAHVDGSADQPASLFDADYQRFCGEHLGPVSQRALGDDRLALGALLRGHDDLARVQLLAWLYHEPSRALADTAIDVGALEATSVARPALLPPLAALGDAVELLRCAVALEAEHHARLPPTRFEAAPREAELLDSALTAAQAWAPRLADCVVIPARALCRRGRLFEREIWIGVPDAAPGPTLDHALWQACHEASLLELLEHAAAWGADAPPERSAEQAALVLLGERAAQHGQQAAHRRWLSHFGRARPALRRDALDAAARQLLDQVI
jgi:hypothetical protein